MNNLKQKIFSAALFLFFPSLAFTDNAQNVSALPLIDKGQQQVLKDHFNTGLKDFNIGSYEFALPELVASTAVTGVYSWQTWYVNAYTTLGVIYEFHSKDPKN